MARRVKFHNLTVTRDAGEVARYKTMDHEPEEKSEQRNSVLNHGPERSANLSSLSMSLSLTIWCKGSHLVKRNSLNLDFACKEGRQMPTQVLRCT